MTGSKKTVLIVDDELIVVELLTEYLSAKFDVISASSGSAGLASACKNNPDLIILDVNLGDMDGREVSQQITTKLEEKAPPIIFISADSDDETILSCFESGADDYITKPFSPSQIVQKVESLFKYQFLFQNLKNQSDELSELVSSTMSQASSYGSLLNTVKKLNYCQTESEIADCIFSYLTSENMNSAVFFKTPHSTFCFDSQAKICSPMLKEVFELTHNRQRLFKLKSRLIASDKHVSLLIKNPPPEDSEPYGIFIDTVAVLIEALEARYMGYLREQELSSLHGDLSEVITELTASMEDVRAKKQKLIDDIVLRIGLSFHELDMTEEQEVFFNKMLEDTVMGHDDTNVVVMGLQQKLTKLVSEINDLVTPLEKLTEVTDDDIELF